jgi:serine/threonine-protein kinase
VGGPPFVGGPLDIATQQMEKAPLPPRSRGASIGADFEESILECLAVDPDERPDAAELEERLLPAGAAGVAASQVGRDANGRSSVSSGIAHAGTAKAAGGGAIRRVLGRRASASGPPEETITLPTRTFRSGARPRAALALLTMALVVLILAGAGAWALLGSNAGEQAAPPEQNAGQEQAAGPSGDEAQKPGPQEEPANGGRDDSAGSGSQEGQDGASQEEPNTALPPEQAEQAVFDMYYEMSFATPETSWAFLSERLQNEIGSVEQWAEQEDIYTFEYMTFEGYQLPQATISGDEAEVTFAVRLDHTWGSEVLSGTWVCVVEGGEWKLDRLKGEERQTV